MIDLSKFLVSQFIDGIEILCTVTDNCDDSDLPSYYKEDGLPNMAEIIDYCNRHFQSKHCSKVEGK